MFENLVNYKTLSLELEQNRNYVSKVNFVTFSIRSWRKHTLH